MAADDFEFMGDQPIHRNRRSSLLRQQQTDLYMSTASAQAFDGCPASCRVAQGVDRCVGTTLCMVLYRRADVANLIRP